MGVFVALLSAVFATSKDLVSKRLAHRLDGMVSTFASFAFALPYYATLLTILYLLGHETFIFTQRFFVFVLLRSVTDTFAEGMKMHALAHGDVSIVSSVLSMSPILLLFTSPLITGDEITLLGMLGVILVVAGSLVLAFRPSAEDWSRQKRGILLSLGAAFFFSLNNCFDRLAVKEATPVFSGFAMTLFSAFLMMPLVIWRGDRLQALSAHRLDFSLRGLLETAFMVCKLYALQFLAAQYVAGLQRASLILSIIGGRIFFKEFDFRRRLAAGVLILIGVTVITLAQSEQSAQAESVPVYSNEYGSVEAVQPK